MRCPLILGDPAPSTPLSWVNCHLDLSCKNCCGNSDYLYGRRNDQDVHQNNASTNKKTKFTVRVGKVSLLVLVEN